MATVLNKIREVCLVNQEEDLKSLVWRTSTLARYQSHPLSKHKWFHLSKSTSMVKDEVTIIHSDQPCSSLMMILLLWMLIRRWILQNLVEELMFGGLSRIWIKCRRTIWFLPQTCRTLLHHLKWGPTRKLFLNQWCTSLIQIQIKFHRLVPTQTCNSLDKRLTLDLIRILTPK